MQIRKLSITTIVRTNRVRKCPSVAESPGILPYHEKPVALRIQLNHVN